ncbi:MAG: prepilin-type N-terminal cleavage/methylation domain-containing protein [Desulfuromonadaceae bacterium]|nr:prepilin-type N-terminal cleavage/methylation domain-containing protein [Desulfuromonadaceae bacterium]
MTRLASKQRGFTLVELVVVIVVLGILAAVAAPRFFDLDFYKQRAFHSELVSALRYAHKKAVACGAEVRVVIGSGGFALTLDDGTFVVHPSGGDFVNAKPAPMALTAETLVFDALGRALVAAPKKENIGYAGSGITLWRETGCVTQ